MPADPDAEGSEQLQKFTQFIFEACMASCIEIGSHKHGCCVMQRCLEKGREQQKLALADVIIKNLPQLIEDPYGNYLVQNVLKLNNEPRNEAIFGLIAKDFIRLSQMKFSSNVIEKVNLFFETHLMRVVLGEQAEPKPDRQDLEGHLQR